MTPEPRSDSLIEGHRIEILIEDDYPPRVRLICPGIGKGCLPAAYCENCGWCEDDPDSPERGACCPPQDECWAKPWVDDMGAELLCGKVMFTVPVEVEWDGEGCFLVLPDQPRSEGGEDG